MKKKTIITTLIFIVVILLTILFWQTGRARTDVYLKSFKVSQDGKTMTLNVDVLSSSGYIRKMKQTSGSLNYYYTFYSTFGINSKIGSKDSFEIKLDENVDEIYFFKGNKIYKKVLEKSITGEWIRPNEIKTISTEIYDTSITGTKLIIKDENKANIYGEWYKIEKEENKKWLELPTIIENYGFTDIAYYPNENNEVKFVIDWEWLYGKLSKGNYRLVKKVNQEYIYIPFSIGITS